MFIHRKINVIEHLRKQGAIIGSNCTILSGVDVFSTEAYLVEIGNNVLISTDVKFYCHDGAVAVLNRIRNEKNDLIEKIVIGSNCFFGHGATILRGTHIGDNCIIGAGAVVKGVFPSNSVIAGVPAKVICDIDTFYEKNKYKLLDLSKMTNEEKKEFLLQHFRERQNKSQK